MFHFQNFIGQARNKNWLPSLFFILLAIIGLSIYKDYGISWDEPVERLTGIVNLNYIGEFFHLRWIQNDPVLAANSSLHLLQYSDRYFGPAFGIISVFLERLFRISDEQQIYFFRHLLNFAIFFFGVHALYQLGKRRFASWQMGLVTALMLVLSPRLFGESFYNSKDLIFLSVFCIGLNSMVKLIFHPSTKHAIIHGLITALAIDTRSIGIVLPALTIFYFIARQILHGVRLKQIIVTLLIYIASLTICVTVFWPFLWSNPLGNFVETLGKFSKWGTTQVAVLYLGKLYQIQKTQLPWHYVFTWIGVTTPVIYIALWFWGAIITGWQLIKTKATILKSDAFLQDVIFLSASLGPIIAIVVLHSVIYDGWRHLYFVYPSFLLIAAKGIYLIFVNKRLTIFSKKSLMVIFGMYLVSIGYWIAANHPNQNIFFNSLAGKDWNTKFDVDYWGLSTRQALEEISRTDNRPKILIYAGSVMLLNDSLKILLPAIRARFEITDNLEKSNYILTNYRNELRDYSLPPYSYELIYEIKSGNEKIISVYENIKTYSQLTGYKAGDVVSFAKGGAGNQLLGSGWAYPEDWGVWSDGKFANFVIPTIDGAIKNINITLKPYIPALGTQQTFEICISSQNCKKYGYISNGVQYISINLRSLPNQKVIPVSLIFHSPYEPKKFGNPSDSREISIGLISIELK